MTRKGHVRHQCDDIALAIAARTAPSRLVMNRKSSDVVYYFTVNIVTVVSAVPFAY